MSTALSIEDGEKKQETKTEGDGPRGIWQRQRHCWEVAMKTFDLNNPWGYRAFLTAYMIVIFFHPLHYYAFVIDWQNNCWEIKSELYATFAVVAFFNTYMLLYVPNVIKKIFLGTISKEEGIEHFIFTQVPILLMTLTILSDMTKGTTGNIFVLSTNLFLFGYMLLVIGLSITIRNASKRTGFISKFKWTKAVFNLFLYLHGGHVFGAVWYCFAIHRVLVCWKKEYILGNKNISENALKFGSFLCSEPKLGNLSCHKTAGAGGNITDFGIFKGALDYKIVEMKPFLKKYLFCLRWGLQVLSCFGQNLEPSTIPLENIYVISVIIYSTLLFVFLIGNMQTYLQSRSERPEDIVNNMKMEKRLEKLKKVQELGNWEESLLRVLCNRMKPAFYGDRTLVLREGEPISEILFVLQGKLWTYTSPNANTDDSSNGENDHLENGAIIGEELVSWIQAQRPSSTLPLSTRTIRTLSHVEAVAITAHDLKDVFINKPKPPEISPKSLLKNCNLTECFRSRNRENL